MIDIDGLAFTYPHSDFRLRVPELTVNDGGRVALVGPSGSGKTTLLNLIAGVVSPGAGRVTVHGVDVTALGDSDRRDFRIAQIGMVFQEFELLDYLDVIDNVLLPYRITNALKLDSAVRQRARRIVEEVGLGDKMSRNVRNLSQGERQRVAVCRSLVTNPPLLLCDEPTGNLDPANKDHVLDLVFDQVARNSTTLLAVTHDRDILERFERVIDIKEFQSIGAGRPE